MLARRRSTVSTVLSVRTVLAVAYRPAAMPASFRQGRRGATVGFAVVAAVRRFASRDARAACFRWATGKDVPYSLVWLPFRRVGLLGPRTCHASAAGQAAGAL
jgi:hypothetical protein